MSLTLLKSSVSMTSMAPHVPDSSSFSSCSQNVAQFSKPVRPSCRARSERSIFSRTSLSTLVILPMTEIGRPSSFVTRCDAMRIQCFSPGLGSYGRSTEELVGDVSASSISGSALAAIRA